jgi:hypothetical protein
MPSAPGRPSYQIAGGPSGSKPGVVSGLLTPVSEQTSGLPEKVKDFDNGGETLGGQQKKRFSEVNQAAKDAFLREANRFPTRSFPIEPERTKTEYFDRYGTLSREPYSASGFESFILDVAIQSIIETGTAIYQTGLYLFDSVVILGEGGLTGLTYLYGGTENAYQHRYSPKSTVYNQLFSGKITTGEAILMVEMNYGVTVLTLSPLARLGRVPKPGPVNVGGVVAPKGLPPTTAESVADKLRRYMLDPNHPVGGDKATWFRKALGFTQENLDYLARQIKFDPAKAIATELTQHGQKFEQVIQIVGANGKRIDVLFVWIRNNDGVVRLVTSTLGV